MVIRQYQASDAEALIAIFRNAVRMVASRDYTHEQVLAWAPEIIDVDQFSRRRTSKPSWVAEIDNQAVGFSDLEPDGHIDMLYVHPEFQRMGVARTLITHIEDIARNHNLTRLFTEASITARPVFEAMRFRVVKSQTATVRGVSMTNYRMEKNL